MVEPAVENDRVLTPVPMVGPTAMPAPPGEEYLHELRVRIPVDLHRQLLSLKVLRGKSLAETVSTALDIYFQEHARKVGEASDRSEA